MTDLADYEGFLTVVEEGSLTAAAHRLGRSLQSVSRSLAALEAELGATLVRRTTRRSLPTEAGLAFHARLKPALAEIRSARQAVTGAAAVMSGRLRIAASPLFAAAFLVSAAAELLERHPGLALDFVLAEDYADLVAGGCDVAIRIGALPDSALRARRLGLSRRVVIAAPSYVARRGAPDNPAALREHDCIVRTSAREGDAWTFSVAGRIESTTVAGRFRADGAAACNSAVIAGLGIGTAMLWQVRDHLDQGRLTILLADYEIPPMPVQALWPPGQAPERVRAFIDLLARRLATERL